MPGSVASGTPCIKVKEQFIAVTQYRASRKWDMLIIQKNLIKAPSKYFSLIVSDFILIFLLKL